MFNVMVVEDDVMTNIFIQKNIEKYGATVMGSFFDAETTLEALHINSPQLVFMDINIKGSIDGLQLAKKIYSLEPSIQIIYITAYSDDTLLDEIFSLENTTHHMVKPVQEKELNIALRLAEKKYHQCHKPPQQREDTHIKIESNLYYDTASDILLFQDNTIKLSKQQSIIIKFFVTHPNTYFTCKDLREKLYKNELKTDVSIRDSIRRLRANIPQFPIETSYANGYILHY